MNLLTHALVLAETTADADTSTGGGGGLIGLLPFLIIGLLFWFLIIRPQRKRQADQQALLKRVSIGDEVITIGGMHGTIIALADDTMELEIAPGTVITMARNAISRTLTEPAPLTLDDDDFDFDDDADDDLDDDFDDDEFGFDDDDDLGGGADQADQADSADDTKEL